MAKYFRKYIEATQWFRNGDHPLDDCFRVFEDTGEIPTQPREGAVVRYFRHPDAEFAGKNNCPRCHKPYHEHGFLDNATGTKYMVCPGQYVVADDAGGYYTMDQAQISEFWIPETRAVFEFFARNGSSVYVGGEQYLGITNPIWLKANADFKLLMLSELPQQLKDFVDGK